jgi:hypothetical protein
MQTTIAPPTDIPIDVLEHLLRDHLADQTAMITGQASAPFAHQGTNDSTTLLRVSLTYTLPAAPGQAHTATWIVKHWQADGARDGALHIAEPREVLAWEQGWLRPDALPAHMCVPFIGAYRSIDGSEAWLAMADVSAELAAYPRLAMSGSEAVSAARTILARLAGFHARWEQPARQAALQPVSWLRRPEQYLWDMARTYAHALGGAPAAHGPLDAYQPPAWDGLDADLAAFLDSRPRDERSMWEQLLIDRRSLVDALAPYPHTLLHNDLDDRNIGLRGSRDLVLIDWEWLALGPAALDVAKLVLMLPVVIAPATPIPEVVWSDAFAEHYFAHYVAAGGTCSDPAEWRRSYGLAVVAQGVIQMPFTHGRMLRAIAGELPPPPIAGVPAQVIRQAMRESLPAMEQMPVRVVREARRWLE